MFTCRLFGPLTLEKDGVPVAIPSQPGRALLAYLLYYADETHSRLRLCDLFWPDLDEATARRRLSYALWTLGQACGDGLILRHGDRLQINALQINGIDVHQFEVALTQTDLPSLRRAVDLYTGPLLTDDYSDWVLAEQERLREHYLQALQRLILAYKAAQNFEQAVQTALTLIQADPLREATYQEAIRLYQILGRAHEAGRLYKQLTSTLQVELGIDPSEQTRTLLTTAPAASPDQTHRSPFVQNLPLVGRTQERRILLDHLGRAIQGQGGVIFVTGEPGVGKSRLLEALAEDAAWRGAVVMRGRAQDLTGEVPYGPLVEALKGGLSPLRAQQAASLLDRLWLSVAAMLLPQLAEGSSGVSALPAMKPDQERIRLMEGLVRLILALAQVGPLLLILEDLHWADAATLDVLAYLAQRLTTSRAMVVISFRSVEARQSGGVWGGLEAIDRASILGRIEISPLSLEETGELVQRSLALPQPATIFTARIYAETGGNPLFVLESLRTLYAEGLLSQDRSGAWETPFDADTTDYTELPLLPAVEETIARRLAQLDATGRQLLGMASVAGRAVSLFTLAELTQLGSRDLLLAIGGLVQQGLLRETATDYCFSHDVVRKTVYAALAADDRRRLHRRMLDVLGEDGAAALLAYHCEQAGLAQEAGRHYVAAGEQAAALHAYRQALAHFDRAEILMGKDAPSLTRLLFARERVLDVLGLRERQRADLDRLSALTADDTTLQIRLEQRYGQMLATLGDYPAARAQLDRALTLARAGDDRTAQARILAAAGEIAYWSGESEAALSLLEEAIDLSRQGGDLAIEAEAESSLSAALVQLGRYAESLAAANRSTALYQAVGDRVGEADVLSAIGAILSEQGDAAGAERGYAQALTIHREVGYRYGEARTLINWGVVSYMQGLAGAALAHFEAASQIAQEIDSQRAWSFAEISIAAVISTYVGNTLRGRRAIDGVIALQREQGNKTLLAQALSILAQFDYLAGDLTAALAHMDEALAVLADSAEMPFLLAQIVQARSLALRRLGRAAEALADVERALTFHASHNLGDLAAGFLANKAQILREQGQLDAATEAIRMAVDGLTPGASQPYLIHFEHYNVMLALGRADEAGAALVTAYEALNQMFETLALEDQAFSRTGIPEHAAILAAWTEHEAAARAIQTTVMLPRVDAPLGRPLREDEQILVTWTLETPQDRAIGSKSKRRRGQIVRLLREARAQGAVPAYRHLADALGVSERTILRDMAMLTTVVDDLPPTRG